MDTIEQLVDSFVKSKTWNFKMIMNFNEKMKMKHVKKNLDKHLYFIKIINATVGPLWWEDTLQMYGIVTGSLWCLCKQKKLMNCSKRGGFI